MSSTFDGALLPGAAGAASEPEIWWYKRGGESHGPVSTSSISALLGQKVVDGSTLIWREDFGPHWKRYDETSLWHQEPTSPKPPGVDYGRWSTSFAKTEQSPKARQFSWLGLIFGPFYYLYLRMWAKGLTILAVALGLTLVTTIICDLTDTPTVSYSTTIFNVFCALAVKRDYYRFRVLGERMWPRYHYLSNLYIVGALNIVLLLAIGFFALDNDADTLASDIAGVWTSDGTSMTIQTNTTKPYVILGGRTAPVVVKSVDAATGVIVLKVKANSTLLTLRKKYSDENHSDFTLDLYMNDKFVANMGYVRPN